MKTGWTVALVIAASLSAQTAVAGDDAQGAQDLPVLFRLLTTARLVSGESAFADALVIHSCSSRIAGPAQHCIAELQPCPDSGTVPGNPPVFEDLTGGILLKFDIEVRGP